MLSLLKNCIFTSILYFLTIYGTLGASTGRTITTTSPTTTTIATKASTSVSSSTSRSSSVEDPISDLIEGNSDVESMGDLGSLLSGGLGRLDHSSKGNGTDFGIFGGDENGDGVFGGFGNQGSSGKGLQDGFGSSAQGFGGRQNFGGSQRGPQNSPQGFGRSQNRLQGFDQPQNRLHSGPQSFYGHENSDMPHLPLFNVSQDQIKAFFNILHNNNLTKAELKNQLDNWAKNQSELVQETYTNFTSALEEMRANATAKIQERISSANLSFDAKTASILNAQDLTRTQEFEAIRSVLNVTSLEIRKEVAVIFGITGRRYGPGGDGGQGSPDGGQGCPRSSGGFGGVQGPEGLGVSLNGVGARQGPIGFGGFKNHGSFGAQGPNQAGGIQILILPMNDNNGQGFGGDRGMQNQGFGRQQSEFGQQQIAFGSQNGQQAGFEGLNGGFGRLPGQNKGSIEHQQDFGGTSGNIGEGSSF